GCASSNNGGAAGTGSGISAGTEAQVLACNVWNNRNHGIQVGQRALVINCNANTNGTGTTGSGIVTDIRATVRHCNADENQNSRIRGTWCAALRSSPTIMSATRGSAWLRLG